MAGGGSFVGYYEVLFLRTQPRVTNQPYPASRRNRWRMRKVAGQTDSNYVKINSMLASVSNGERGCGGNEGSERRRDTLHFGAFQRHPA